MTNDIVAQLRSSDFCSCEIIYRAADRIEALEGALREIEYLDRPQVRGLPRRKDICEIARAALEGKDGQTV